MRTESKEKGSPYSCGARKMAIMDSLESMQAISPLTTINMTRASPTRCKLVDCRSFMAFNVAHIRGAVNIHCPPILKRRLLRGSATLSALVSCPESKVILEEADTIIFYDDRTCDWKDLENDSTMKIVAKLLRWEKRKATLFYIKGGFERFSALFSTMCEFIKPCNSSLTSPLKLKLMTSADGRKPFSPRWDTDNKDDQLPRAHPNSVNEPVELLPHLYLGSELHASRRDVLKRLGISAIVNVSRNIPNTFEDSFTYKTIPVDDTYNADIGVWFEEAAGFIDSVKASGGRVLVHCQAGISRSATICLAYLISRLNFRLDEAYEYVKKRRSVISPNFNFMGQLLHYETQTMRLDNELEERCDDDDAKPFEFFKFSPYSCNTDQVVPTAESPELFATPI
ncbi:dual specificity protein phosphatase 1 isoform X2 [Nematostella vectensis]|uniref:dual specificity protein phosphatase 1 isoform X2 n=1 Tax=Nematostella vectensis TaxID=45351 RepID=UPI0020772DCD|nr:dual specificity protein phosphatase 1 isoform X2 [Nematostella vectensis]